MYVLCFLLNAAAAPLFLVNVCVIFFAKGVNVYIVFIHTFLFSLMREHAAMLAAAAVDHHTADLQINSYVESTGNIQFFVHIGGYQSLPVCAREEELQNTDITSISCCCSGSWLSEIAT